MIFAVCGKAIGLGRATGTGERGEQIAMEHEIVSGGRHYGSIFRVDRQHVDTTSPGYGTKNLDS